MALTKQERDALQREISSLKARIGNKEEILSGYEKDPKMARYIPGLKNEITGLKRSLRDYVDALQKG